MAEAEKEPDITVKVDRKFATWLIGGLLALLFSNGLIGGRQVQNTDTVTTSLSSLNSKVDRLIELLEAQNAQRKRTTANTVPEMLGIVAPGAADSL